MTEVARTRGTSSEIERGVVPEVAELGNELKELFHRLGISQSQYAHRVHLDKSVVSRYLTGRRVAPQEFVDRLVAEVETHVGAPLRPAAKEALRTRRLEALRVTDPGEFRLERLRDELARSRRDAERAHRNVDALHALLEKREAEARAASDELDRLRLDWGAEIAALRRDLADAEALRLDAERRGEELREEILRLEEELSRRSPEGGGGGLLPPAVFQEQLEGLWEAEEFAEAGRELTEAAWTRPLEEAAELLAWLGDSGRDDAAEHFVSDVGRLRPLDDVLRFAPQITGRVVAWERAWVFALASRMTERNAATLYDGLKAHGGMWRSQADGVLATAVRRLRVPDGAVRLVVSALVHESSLDRLEETTRALTGSSSLPGVFAFPVMAGLAEAGRWDVAVRVAAEYLRRQPNRYDPRLERVFRGLTDLPEEQVDMVLEVMAGLEPGHGAAGAAEALAKADDPSLLDRFLGAVSTRDGLDLLEQRVRRSLAGRIREWRASRRQ
ncbi:helix-turn-helix transcriptional regulator [Streptomyces sp. NPDC004787]|uniref:helix-turn-helix domain-containing protein n=1 Tax=Streptomyces sp. NPDC004787 TaxID=3154291 RepID=UPI0033A5BD30